MLSNPNFFEVVGVLALSVGAIAAFIYTLRFHCTVWDNASTMQALASVQVDQRHAQRDLGREIAELEDKLLDLRLKLSSLEERLPKKEEAPCPQKSATS